MKRFFALVLSGLIWLCFPWSLPAIAAEPIASAEIEPTEIEPAEIEPAEIELAEIEPAEIGQLFELHCAGCHPGGGNIIRRNKTLKLKALQRNQMDSVAAIAAIITNGKANMSAYGDRFTEAEIQQLAAYVLERAENNWK